MSAPVIALGDHQSILSAARVIADSGLVVAPTETRYGILARVDSEVAVQRLFDLKGRKVQNPTAVFVAARSHIGRLALVTPIAQELSEAFLPGPLTLVLESRVDWAAPLVVDGKIGIRLSSSELIQQLVEAVESPLTATSANLTGEPDRETVADIQKDFGERIDLYIDGGSLTGPVSTVVECVGQSYRILRAGAISIEQIEQIAGRA